MTNRYLMAIAIAAFPAAAAAQESAPAPAATEGEGVDSRPAETATAAATDAFGETVGVERIGLYNLFQTRGFNLVENSGAFRIEDAFYFPAGFPAEALLAGSTIRVGASAARLDLPSPTGVIAFRIRRPGPDDRLSVTTGLRAIESPVMAADADIRLTGDAGLHVAAVWEPDQTFALAERGSRQSAALVGEWNATPGLALTGFAGWQRDRQNGYNYVLSAGDAAPAALPADTPFAPDWLEADRRMANIGALARFAAGGWSARASAIHSRRFEPRSDTQVLSLNDDGMIAARLLLVPEQSARADIFEGSLDRTFSAFGMRHRVGIAARYRDSLSRRAEATVLDGGSFTRAGPDFDLPVRTPIARARGRDTVRQSLLGANYTLMPGGGLTLRGGANRSHYDKRSRGFGGEDSRNVETDWLYNLSAGWTPASGLALFAGYVTGLEEAGIAPSVATNRGEVLPPVESRQYEVGVSYALDRRLTLIAAAFDIAKPTYGIDASGAFAPIGRVRHRGIETSLTGNVSATTRIVAGANILDPVLERAADGTVRAPGVSTFNAVLGFEHDLGGGLSLDANFLWEGPRRRDARSPVELPGVAFLNVGARQEISVGRTPLVLRARIFNLADVRGFYATPNGPVAPVFPRSFELTVTADF